MAKKSTKKNEVIEEEIEIEEEEDFEELELDDEEDVEIDDEEIEEEEEESEGEDDSDDVEIEDDEDESDSDEEEDEVEESDDEDESDSDEEEDEEIEEEEESDDEDELDVDEEEEEEIPAKKSKKTPSKKTTEKVSKKTKKVVEDEESEDEDDSDEEDDSEDSDESYKDYNSVRKSILGKSSASISKENFHKLVASKLASDSEFVYHIFKAIYNQYSSKLSSGKIKRDIDDSKVQDFKNMTFNKEIGRMIKDHFTDVLYDVLSDERRIKIIEKDDCTLTLKGVKKAEELASNAKLGLVTSDGSTLYSKIYPYVKITSSSPAIKTEKGKMVKGKFVKLSEKDTVTRTIAIGSRKPTAKKEEVKEEKVASKSASKKTSSKVAPKTEAKAPVKKTTSKKTKK